ncbi:MAG: ABC transporter ATP-binding protein [Firmicutes bacterium]|nr:ABC transporter ATP-binding protein [Bacillota bacterium]
MLKTLLSYVKEYKSNTLKAPFYVAIEVVLEVAIPFLMSRLVDLGINHSDMGAVIKYGILMMICAVFSLFAGALSGKHAAIASSGFAKNIREAEYRKIQEFSFTEIDKYSTSSLITRMTTDVNNITMAFQMIIRVAVRSPLMLISSLYMAFMVNAKLASIFVVVIIFLASVLIFVTFSVHKLFTKMFRRYDKLNQSVQENITGIRVVKSFVRETFEIAKFKKESSAIFKIQKRAEMILILNQPAMMLSVYACMLGVSYVGAKLIVGGEMTTGALMSLFTYIMAILMSLMMLSMIFVMVTMSIANMERVTEILTQESSLTSPKDGVKEVKNGEIEFDNVFFNYGKMDNENEYVLTDINLKIASGSTLGILGATGSSKSSLVQLIPRLYDVCHGSVKVGGVDVRHYDLDVLRDSVAMVLQKNVLFSGTINDNMRWGNPNATDEEIQEACRLAQADEFIQQKPKKYDDYIERGGANVSGGQRQRLCIARALLKNPKILILDDSTSAVDTKTDALIRQAFLEKIPDTTRIIIAQRISSIQDADKIIVLEDGKIIGEGTHDELVQNCAHYRETYFAQNKNAKEEMEAKGVVINA